MFASKPGVITHYELFSTEGGIWNWILLVILMAAFETSNFKLGFSLLCAQHQSCDWFKNDIWFGFWWIQNSLIVGILKCRHVAHCFKWTMERLLWFLEFWSVTFEFYWCDNSTMCSVYDARLQFVHVSVLRLLDFWFLISEYIIFANF